MFADAIIFDKDGTLLDFDAFWLTISFKALDDVLVRFEKQEVPKEELLESLGVYNGVTDIDGVLCRGTYGQMGQCVYEVLKRYGCTASCDEVVDVVVDAYEKNFDIGEIKPTCQGLTDALIQLKKQNKKLAVVTTDNEKTTRKCLKALGIEEMFDKIYTDDGKVPTKPDPYCALDFCREIGADKSRVVMVGDTLTDVEFAKNAGISVIAVAKSDKSRAILSPLADAVVSDIQGILDIVK